MKLEIFDPAMCCSTGVCGPSVDPELTRIASAVSSLQKKGYQIQRYNLANDPGAFTGNEKASEFLHTEGPDALPLVLLNGESVMKSTYPSNDQLAEWFEVQKEELNTKPQAKPVTINISELKS